jgi:hypothetical protein
MSANEDKSPYGRGFIAACIVIGAILLCGALLLFSNPAASGTTGSSASASTAQGADVPSSPNAPDADRPADPASCNASASDKPASCEPSSGEPAVPASGEPKAGSGGCGLPAGDQGTPATAPSVDGWDVSRRVVVPRSSAYGPAKQDSDGFRRCFAHSPTGAVYAAYNAVAAMADQRKVLATVGKLMLPGPDRDALLADLRKEPADEDTNPTQIAGYRVLDASADRATVMLAMPVETAFVGANFTLVWHHGDWRVAPPPPGEPLGAPYAQRRDLSGFVAWSGV